MNSTMSERSQGSQSQMSSKLYHSAFLSNQIQSKEASKKGLNQVSKLSAKDSASLQRRKQSNYSQMFTS
jgi:hypothetical protein